MSTSSHSVLRTLLIAAGFSAIVATIPVSVAGAQTKKDGSLLPLSGKPGSQRSLLEEAAGAVSMRLLADPVALAPGGEGIIAIHLEISPGWHTYWENAGDTGFPITWNITAPAGVELGAAQWTAPKRYLAPGDILDYVYEGQATVFIPVRVLPEVAPGSSLSLTADVEWLVCREGCVPGGSSGKVSISVVAPGSPIPGPAEETARVLSAARGALPQLWEQAAAEGVQIQWTGDILRIHAPGTEQLMFFPSATVESRASDLIRSGATQGDRLEIAYRGRGKLPPRAKGVLGVNRNGATRYFSIDTESQSQAQ